MVYASSAAVYGDQSVSPLCETLQPQPLSAYGADKLGCELHARVATMFPTGRWGTTDDVANLVGFLVGDAGAWIQGQVINSEGGFRRA